MRTRKQPRTRRKSKAATSDVLGQARQAARISPKWRRHYNRLLQLRDHLRHRQVGLAQDARQEQPSLSTHMADAGTDAFDRDFATAVYQSQSRGGGLSMARFAFDPTHPGAQFDGARIIASIAATTVPTAIKLPATAKRVDAGTDSNR